MNHRLLYILLPAAALGIGLFLFLNGKEDPRQLALGEWQEKSKSGFVEVTDDSHLQWRAANRRGKMTYRWLQTEQEPYRVEVRRGQNSRWEADVTFEGKDDALVAPDILHLLPDEAVNIIRQKNKAKGRPENEFIFHFRRVKSAN